MGSQSKSVFRIVSNKYPPFDGTGAYKWGSRWVEPGRYVVHAAGQYSLAVLENLVHWNVARLPPTLACVVATIPDSVSQSEVNPRKLDDQDYCRKIGNKWYDKAEVAVLWVPSVISPYEKNVLINQTHQDFSKIKITKTHDANIDARLLKPTS